jgi:hypothetical protein
MEILNNLGGQNWYVVFMGGEQWSFLMFGSGSIVGYTAPDKFLGRFSVSTFLSSAKPPPERVKCVFRNSVLFSSAN